MFGLGHVRIINYIKMVKDCEEFTFNIIDSSCILATNLTSTEITVLNVSGKEKYPAVTGY